MMVESMLNRARPYQVCVFDWDGTLVDSERHIVESLAYAAASMRLPPLAYAKLKDVIGLSMQKALSGLYPGLSGPDIESMRKHYADHFFSVPQDETTLFTHVTETLARLQEAGIKLAVATGKSRHGLDKALSSTGLKSFFEIERCADETLSKPDPLMLMQISAHFNLPPSAMLMVGDTEYDLEMARRCGMDSVGVSYGVHDRERLVRHEPLAIIDCFSELLEYAL
jgi:phosphoglycolate phosphatase